MSYASPILDVSVLAKGALPHRPCVHPVTEQSQVTCWRQAQGLSARSPVQVCGFEDTQGQTHLHPEALRQDWNRLCSLTTTPMLVYLHRGHQSDTRCPILQDLLHTLDHRGAVHALRIETRQALHDAMELSRALASRHGLVLVLNDPTRRLFAVKPASAPLRFVLLANDARAQALRADFPDLTHSAFLGRTTMSAGGYHTEIH